MQAVYYRLSFPGTELKMAVANSKNKVCDLLAFIHQKATLALIISMALVACGKSDQPTEAPPAALPVSVIEVQPTSVPISAEAVAQPEGAKEVEIRPRVGGICSNACMKRALR